MKISKLLFCVVLLVLFLATASTAQETLIQSIVRYHEFFVQLRGYSGSLLSDVEVIERGKSLGIILVSQEGFEEHLVFDVASMTPIYSNARILNKDDRVFLIETSIQMSEVSKLARAAKIRAAELRREWQLYEGKPGNIIPRNPPEKKIEPEPKPSAEPVAQIRENNDIRVNGNNIDNKPIIDKEIKTKLYAMSKMIEQSAQE